MKFAFTMIVFFLAFDVNAVEGVRHDGRKVNGTLALTEQRTLTFHVEQQAEPITTLEFVRFPAQATRVGQSLRLHRIVLSPQESFTAELLRLDERHLHVRTLWSDSLAVPRSAIERVIPLEQPVLHESFADELTPWKLTGQPTRAAGQLRLEQRGQQIEHTLSKPRTQGKLTVRALMKQTQTRRGRLECDWTHDGKPQTLSIELCGPEANFSVVGGTPHLAPKVARAGQDRLSIEFDPTGLHIVADEVVVWSSRQNLGELQAFRLLSDGLGQEAFTCAEVLLSVPAAPPRPWADLTRDAVRSPRGDEQYGMLTELRPHGLTLRSKPPLPLMRWHELHEFTFARDFYAAQTTEGEHVACRFRSIDQHRDRLTGSIATLDAKSLGLNHPVLGLVRLPRPQVEELRLMFHGTLLPADTTPHHLGTRAAFGLSRLKPEGTRWTKTIAVDQPPVTGFLLIDVAFVDPRGTPIELFINNERLDTLNRHVDQRTATVQRVRIPIPVKAWRRGENTLEIRLASSEATHLTSVDVRAVQLELHRSR